MTQEIDDRQTDLKKLQVVAAERSRLPRESQAWRTKLREEEELVAKIRHWSLDPIEDKVNDETRTDMNAEGPDGQVYGG